MKNILIAFIFCSFSFSLKAQNYDYLLENMVGIKLEKVELKNRKTDWKVITEDLHTASSKIETPFYDFLVTQFIGENSDDINNVLPKLKSFAADIKLDTINLNQNLKQITNDFNQSIYYVKYKYSLNASDDESTYGYNYVGVILPNNRSIDEFYIFNLTVFPLYTFFESTDAVISPKFTGLDMIQSIHLNPKYY